MGGGGVHSKKFRRAEGSANIFEVFRVKNHDFTPKNHIFSSFRGGGGGGGAAHRTRRPPSLDPLLLVACTIVAFNIVSFGCSVNSNAHWLFPEL